MSEDTATYEGWTVGDVVRRVLAGHRVLIAVLACVGLAGGVAYSAQATPTFRASTELVTGTYSVPSDIGLREALDGAGPLGLELPAETQARIIASPAVVMLAADELGLDDAATHELLTSAGASPNTDNVFTVSASGRTPTEAAERANALAAAYLTYRKARAAEKLEPLQEEARSNAERARAAAEELQVQINEAQEDEGSTLATALVNQQQEYQRIAQAEGSRETVVTTALESFDGGGTVVRPADATTASGGTSMPRVTAAGLLAGLLVGLALATLVERLRSPVRSAEDVTAATGIQRVVETDRGSRDPVVAARRLWQHRRDTGEGTWPIALVPAHAGATLTGAQEWLAGGFEDLLAAGHEAAGEHGPATGVEVQPFSDVPELCLTGLQHSRRGPDVVVVVRRGQDSGSRLRSTVEDLRDAGVRVLAVALVPAERHLLGRRRTAVGVPAGALPGTAVDAETVPGQPGAEDRPSTEDHPGAQDQPSTEDHPGGQDEGRAAQADVPAARQAEDDVPVAR